MPRFTVRLSDLNDTSAVTKLLQTSYPTLMAPAYAPDVLAAALLSMTTANADLLASGSYFVAEPATGELVGCGGWTPQVPGTGEIIDDIGHIRHFATHPDWTGQGIGRTLYATCEAQASAAGIIEFECFGSLNAEDETVKFSLYGKTLPGIDLHRGVGGRPQLIDGICIDLA